MFFFGADVHQAGDEVGEPRRTLHRLQRRDHLFGNLRQQLQDFGCLLSKAEGTALDVRVGALGLLDGLDSRDRKRIAFEKLQDTKTLRALANRMM